MTGGVATPKLPGVQWLGPGATITIAGYQISAPFMYVTDEPCAAERHPAICDVRTHIGPAFATDPGYWPSWNHLEPGNRGAMLAWMRDGRRQPCFNIGLVFLFFYGLERRVILDRSDLGEIHQEICGLLSVYGENRSFRSYASSLLAIIHVLHRSTPVPPTMAALVVHSGVATEPVVGTAPTADRPAQRLPFLGMTTDLVDVILATRHDPIDATLAIAICQNLPGVSKMSQLKAVWADFSTLFATRFLARWPDGHTLVPVAERTPTKIIYTWAARAQGLATPKLNIPSSLGHASHWAELVAVWQRCAIDVRKLSNLIADGSQDLRARFHALPPELRRAESHPDYAAWSTWFEAAQNSQGYAIATITAVAERSRTVCPSDGKLRPSAMRDIAVRLESLGFAIEPDPRMVSRSVELTEKRVIYRPASGTVVLPGPAYIGIQTIVELCLAVALADGNISEAEIEQIFGMLDRDDELPAPERERLRAHVAYQQEVGGDIGVITARRLAHLSSASRSIIATMVVAIAIADGVVTKAERDALRKVYRALGLPPTQLETLLAPAPTGNATERSENETAPTTGITINWQAVEALQRETNDVQHLLGKALAECAQEEIIPDNPTAGTSEVVQATSTAAPILATPGDQESSPAHNRFPGLDVRYLALAEHLVGRSTMAANAWRDLCAAHGFMPAAAIETINAWSDDTLGDFLITGDDPLTIQTNLLPSTP